MPDLVASWTGDVDLLAPGASPEQVRAVGTDLLRRWGEPHRRYHTAVHLTEMLAALRAIGDSGGVTSREVALGGVAAWFHDAVYVLPDPGDNEAASARLATESLPGLGLAASDVEAVDRLVRASERHALPSGDGLDAAFHDADLWVLSAPVSRFDVYCAQVRQEYAMVPETAYRHGRSAILRPFLARGSVYATSLGRSRWEGRARANLERELTRLGGA